MTRTETSLDFASVLPWFWDGNCPSFVLRHHQVLDPPCYAATAMRSAFCYGWRQCNDATTSIMVYIDNYWFWLLSPLYPSYWPLFLFSIRLVSQKINGRTFWFLLRERMDYCWGIFRNNQNILLRRECQDHIFLVWRHLNSFNIHGQNASNTKWRALCNFKRERPTKSLFIQRTESIGWELNQHFHNQFYQIDLNNASSVTSTSISTYIYISVSASMEHHINHHINPGIFQHLRRSTAAWGIGAAPQKDSESWSQDVPRAWA